MERWLKKWTPFQGKIFSVVAGVVATGTGTTTEREIVEHNGGVAIVPVHEDSVLLIRQFRISVGKEILEIPAGRLELDDDHPSRRAARELEEEVGYTAQRMELVSEYYSSVGFTNERMLLYLASDLVKSKKEGDWDEDIRIVPVKLNEIAKMLAEGKITDSKTIIGLFYCLSRFRDRG